MANELKRCPFCGFERASPIPANKNSSERLYPIVRCMGCFTDVPGKTKDFSLECTTAVERWNTRPAASVEGLETIGYVHKGTAGLLMEGAVSKAVLVQKPGGDFKHPVVFAEQAEAIIAAKDERIEELEDDNAALTARVKELSKHVEELQEKNNAETCACSYDAAGDVCKGHSPAVKALETQLAAATDLLREAFNELSDMEKLAFEFDCMDRIASFLATRAALEVKP